MANFTTIHIHIVGRSYGQPREGLKSTSRVRIRSPPFVYLDTMVKILIYALQIFRNMNAMIANSALVDLCHFSPHAFMEGSTNYNQSLTCVGGYDQESAKPPRATPPQRLGEHSFALSF
jgi:hypothetical protein